MSGLYTPSLFAVTDEAEALALPERLAFGCLVTCGDDGLTASPLPFLFDAERGVLTGHLAALTIALRPAARRPGPSRTRRTAISTASCKGWSGWS
ncbi:MAG: FMN-binding negative transcriptional regulator [Caulobacterales bacterium]|nr:FMN-binding negative transcriptional regulator [Caulobacterales bacterium]